MLITPKKRHFRGVFLLKEKRGGLIRLFYYLVFLRYVSVSVVLGRVLACCFGTNLPVRESRTTLIGFELAIANPPS